MIIFQQMIFGDDTVRTLNIPEEKEKIKKVRKVRKNEVENKPEKKESAKNMSDHKVVDDKQVLENVRQQNDHSKEGRKKVFPLRKGSAFEFVKKYRKESMLNPQKSISKTREQEVSEIGTSLQRRLSEAATSSRKTLPGNLQGIHSQQHPNKTSYFIYKEMQVCDIALLLYSLQIFLDSFRLHGFHW